jgi:SWI/SNF-related matrix-associated actin-dependent regulator of chromatin subfamily A3
MARVALRRGKSKLLNLTQKVVKLQSVTFPKDCLHKEIYSILYASTKKMIRTALLSGKDILLSKMNMEILERMMRIRQACVSGVLIPKTIIQSAKNTMNGDLSAQDDENSLGTCRTTTTAECAKCFEVMDADDAVVLRTCSHAFCELCLHDVLECPVCQYKFEERDLMKSCVAKEQSMMKTMDSLGPSPKLKALVLAIAKMKDDEKGVIFSQFTKLLDLLEPFLIYLGHTFVRIDGSKTALQRNTAITEFNAEVGGPRFILCSLHAAGTGITLTRANHCFIMDPWWNSSAEQQAMDRVSLLNFNLLCSVAYFSTERILFLGV